MPLTTIPSPPQISHLCYNVFHICHFRDRTQFFLMYKNWMLSAHFILSAFTRLIMVHKWLRHFWGLDEHCFSCFDSNLIHVCPLSKAPEKEFEQWNAESNVVEQQKSFTPIGMGMSEIDLFCYVCICKRLLLAKITHQCEVNIQEKHVVLYWP